MSNNMYATEQQSPEDSNQYTNATEATTFRLGESLELGDNVDYDYNNNSNLPTTTKSTSSDYNIQQVLLQYDYYYINYY